MSSLRYFKYFSFISYSRKDEAFAKRLQHFLTGFKLPARLCVQYPDKPKALRPVYRDKTDLGVDNLNKGLNHGLSLSRYLIVICSEHSAKPNRNGKNWVDAEVRAFLELDAENKNYIIPVLLRQKDGPSSSECMPPAVRELNLLATDVSDKGEARVFSDVAAKMLQLEPDELWNWWERNQRFRRRCWYAAGTVAAALSGFVGWAVWDYEAEHYTYFADYEECNNIPQGIHPLTQAETERMESHYRFITQHHRLRRIENVNSAGRKVITDGIPGHEGRPAALSLDYSENTGDVTMQTYYNPDNQPVLKRYVSPKEITFFACSTEGEEMGVTGATFVQNSFENIKESDVRAKNKNVERMGIMRDETGFITEERYLNIYEPKPVENAVGVCGCRYERDNDGRPKVVTYLNAAGMLQPERRGVAKVVYEYYPNSGPVKSISYHARSGKLICGPDGYAVTEYEWKAGNLQKISYFDEQHRLRLFTRVTHDERGNRIKCEDFDANAKPLLNRDGYAFWTATYNERNLALSLTYYGSDGKLRCVADGYAEWRRTYDDRGNVVRTAYYDADGKLCRTKQDYAVCVIEYDACDRPTSCLFLDEQERPCLSRDRFAELRKTYDAHGNMISKAFYDVQGRPVLQKYIYAEVRYEYDERGNVLSEKYLGVDGKLCRCRYGYAERRRTYDEWGHETSTAYYDAEGKRCLRGKPYAEERRVYDACGRVLSLAYYGEDGQLCLHPNGYAELRFAYDERGNRTSTEYYDEAGKLCLQASGFAAMRSSYDERGNEISCSYYGADNRLRMTGAGYAEWRARYDARGHCTERVYYDHAGKRCMNHTGYAVERLTYDSLGNETSVSFLDADERPCMIKCKYEEFPDVVCAGVKATYDEHGNKTSITFLGTDGRPCAFSGDYAGWRMKYDEFGREISRTMFDTEGKKIELPDEVKDILPPEVLEYMGN